MCEPRAGPGGEEKLVLGSGGEQEHGNGRFERALQASTSLVPRSCLLLRTSRSPRCSTRLLQQCSFAFACSVSSIRSLSCL